MYENMLEDDKNVDIETAGTTSYFTLYVFNFTLTTKLIRILMIIKGLFYPVLDLFLHPLN